MRLLLAQRFGVGRRQRGQVTATEKDQQAAEDQAEQQETADQRGGDDLRDIGAVGTDLPLAGDEIIEQAALFFLQFQAALALHRLDHRLPLAAPADHLFGKGQPLPMQHRDALDARQLLGVVLRIVAHQVQLFLEQRQFALVGLEERRLAGDQVAAHRGFDVVEHLLRLVGVGHALHRTLDPMADAQQVIDDGAEEKRAKKTETQRNGHVAVEDALEVALIDEGIAHLVSFPAAISPADAACIGRRAWARSWRSVSGLFLSVAPAFGSAAKSVRLYTATRPSTKAPCRAAPLQGADGYSRAGRRLPAAGLSGGR